MKQINAVRREIEKKQTKNQHNEGRKIMNQSNQINKWVGAAVMLAAALMFASPARATIIQSTLTTVGQLDLTGNFVVAEDTGNGSTLVGGSFTFAPGTYFPGTALANQGHNATDDAGLNTVLNSFNYAPTLSAAIPMTAGSAYKLQLLFDDVSGRGFDDITVEDNLLYLYDATAQSTSGQAVLITATGIVGLDGDVDVLIAHNPILQPLDFAILTGFTLEAIPEPSTVALVGLGGLLLARRVRSKASAVK